MYKKILVAIDIEDARQPVVALTAAAELAGLYKADVHLLHVIPAAPAYVVAEVPATIFEKTRDTTDEVMKAYAEHERFKGIKTSYSIVDGEIYRETLEVAESEGADLIVICAHRKGFADFLLGSNAARIVSHAKCSVFVVRSEIMTS